MNEYFKERMDEIQLRTEQMTERKTYESEIDSLEEKLKGLESNYKRLRTTWKSNLEESALKKVDLVVAKEAHEFAEDMLNKNRVLLVDEKRKLDDLHWQIWEEQIKLSDDMGKCLAENDSVSFLNEYPRVLKMQKYAYLASQESDVVAKHPEVEQLKAEITALQLEIKKAEDKGLAEELKKVLTEISELNSNPNYGEDETQKLIEALERSHCERMALEGEIREIENRRNEVSHVQSKLEKNMSQKESKDFPRVKNEPWFSTSNGGLVSDKKWLKSGLETSHSDELQVIKDKDKKMQARKWYEEYARETAVVDEENVAKKFYSPGIHHDSQNISKQGVALSTPGKNRSFSSRLAPLLPKKITSLRRGGKVQYEDEFEDTDLDDPPIPEFKFHQKLGAKLEISDDFTPPVKSRFFDGKITNSNHLETGISSTLTPVMNLNPEKKYEDVKVVPEKTSTAGREFEPFMATPNSFFKSEAETAIDNELVESRYDGGPCTSTKNVTSVKKIAKFTPKRPSNISKKSAYRQTKLDDFHNFMLPDNKYNM